MNKRIEHLITIAGIAALVAVYLYQVAYGTTANEAYQHGFGLGKTI